MAPLPIRRWRIGQAEIIRIVEIAEHQDDVSVLVTGATRDLILQHDWLAPHFATPDGRMRIAFQCFVVRSCGRQIVIDTCIGNDRIRHFAMFSNMATDFLGHLDEAGVTLDEVDTVLCTHLHYDHVGWNTRLVDGKWVPTFPKARYLFAASDMAHWQQVIATGGDADTAHFPDSIDPIAAAGLVDLVETDHRITAEVSLLPTPGHTPGHVSVLIASDGETAIITGDLAHHPVQLAHPDLHANFDVDRDQGARTRRRFVETYQDTGTLVIGSHFCDPSAGRLERDGESWRLTIDP